MSNYKIIGIDLAKTKFHFAAINQLGEVVLKKAMHRTDFFDQLPELFPCRQKFAFEACGGSHYTAQKLQKLGHEVIMLKPKDVKPYAKSRQKNDINDAIAICKAACDPEIMKVHPKSQRDQEVSYLHKTRQNVIRQRIQRSNSLITSLQEFGYVVPCGKSKFAKSCDIYLAEAVSGGYVPKAVHKQMRRDCREISYLLQREKEVEKEIIKSNKSSEAAQRLQTIPGIGPINASILSIKPMDLYESAKDFSASLGIVPKQNTTGGTIRLGPITKQGDRYARTMLIQAGRTIVMRSCRQNVPEDDMYHFVARLKQKGKPFNKICVAVANKLARIAYACNTKNTLYNAG